MRSTSKDPTEVLLLLEELEELHPLNFKWAFGLTHEQAADELCIEPQTMRAYIRNNPSRRVKRLAAIVAKRWIMDKSKPIVVLEHLLNTASL